MSEQLIKWAKVEAARRQRSLSGWIQDLVQKAKDEGSSGADALGAFLALAPRELKDRPASRAEIYDRAVLRRH